jgi:BlaR1 peptidase M56
MMALAGYPAPAAHLLAGSTLLLGLGVLAVAAFSAPVHRQRAAELAVLATLIWLGAAVVPLPRWFGATSAGVPDRGGDPIVGPSLATPMDARDVRVAPGAESRDAVGPDGGGAARAVGPARGGRTPVAAPRHSPNRWLAVAHIGVSSVVACYVLLGFLLIRRLIGATVGPPAWLAMLFERRAGALGVDRARLRVGRSHRRPLTAGLIRPVVVLPEELVRPGREPELRRVIDHELVHIRRRDVVGRILFAVAAPLLWVHPLFWWLRARAALAAELIADDGAAGDDRAGYARDLLVLAGEMQALRPVPGTAPGTFRNRSELTRRIDMLVTRHDSLAGACSPRHRALQAIVLVAAVAGSVSAFGARPQPARAQTPAASEDGLARAAAPDVVDLGGATDAAEGVAARGEADGGSNAPAAAAETSDDAAVATDGTAGVVSAPAGTAQTIAAEAYDDAALRTRPASFVGGSQLPRAQTQQEPDPGYAATLALVERAVSLESDLALAQAELASLERGNAALQARTGGTVDEFALQRAQILMQSVQRRLAAVRILIETEIEATKLEMVQLDNAIRLGAEGPEARPLQLRLNARLRVLEGVL